MHGESGVSGHRPGNRKRAAFEQVLASDLSPLFQPSLADKRFSLTSEPPGCERWQAGSRSPVSLLPAERDNEKTVPDSATHLVLNTPPALHVQPAPVPLRARSETESTMKNPLAIFCVLHPWPPVVTA